MKILAIETATDACSAALLVDGEIRVRETLAPREHARLILPMMNELLAEAGIALAQLDALAFGRGPGSFTGLRIAAGVVQGAAFAADLPVAPVSTLAALALGAMEKHGQTQVLAALDARMNEVYWAAFRRDADRLSSLLGEEAVLPPSRVPLTETADWFGAGQGWAAYGEVLRERLVDRLCGVDAELSPHAREIARLGEVVMREGGGVSAEQAIPVYLRDHVADVPRALS